MRAVRPNPILAASFAVVTAAASFACSSDPAATDAGVVDSGTSPDAGTGPDSGTSPDAGTDAEVSILPASITCNAQDVCTVPVGDYTADMTWASDKIFVLSLEGQQGPANVFIKGSTLTIKPGTQIFASGRIALVIDRGAKIEASGTADRPIVFSSAAEIGQRGRGDWGGIVINGRAPANCSSEASGCQGEGSSGEYGGNDPADSSGTLRYVRVEFAGAKISETNEYNGIALQGVGSGTTLEYIQLHLPSDDGIEFFGGTVNAKHIVISGSGDDSIDWTFGWSGKLQFAAIVQYSDDADNGFESDNNESNHDITPRSSPTLSNVTIASHPDKNGLLLRRGTAAQIWNTVVTGAKWCVDIDSIPSTFNQLTAGDLVLRNTLHHCTSGAVRTNDELDANMMPLADADSNGPVDAAAVITTEQTNNTVGDPLITIERTAGVRPSFVPAAGSPALSGGAKPDDAFFEAVDFLGAMKPGSDWTTDWTDFPAN
ncbi:hypothetical protein L6R52_06370 [Myxococcota bacterium]|nr:hypothetical protein [Myxococcota bacterium]